MNGNKGFTLVEMLVTIGIIAILSAISIGAVSKMKRNAYKAQEQAQVSDIYTAMTAILQAENAWPDQWIGQKELTRQNLIPFITRNFLGLTGNETAGGTGVYKFGMLDPWGERTVRGNAKATQSSAVSSGGKIENHVVRFAVDEDYDGITEFDLGTQAGDAGRKIKIRAVCAVWSAGPNGVIDDYDKAIGGGKNDDSYSWTRGQEVK